MNRMQSFFLLLKNILRIVKWEIRYRLGSTKLVYYYFYLLDFKKFRSRIYKHPDIIIEGFGGSANSFLVHAFVSAQEKDVKVIHHLHVPYPILAGIQGNIPTIVIIRNPVDAVASLMSRNFYPSVKYAFIHYIRFYRDILKVKDHIVIAEFNDIISNYCSVIENLNQKYNTRFKYHVDDVVKARKKIRELRKDPSLQPLPTDDRKVIKQKIMSQVMNDKYHKLRTEALQLYNQILEN